MIDYLPHFWVVFLLVWLGSWILKCYLNYRIYKIKKETRPVQQFEKSGFTIFMVMLFTLYNPWSKFDEPHFRKLKYRTNLFHLIHFYSVGLAILFSIIVQFEYEINHPTTTYNHRYSNNECSGNSSDAQFGMDYNTERMDEGIIPLPNNFCFSSYSDSKTEIWKHSNPDYKPYFHQVKYVYIEAGEWVGEYDIFVHQEAGQTDETLNVDVVLRDGVMQKQFRHDTEVISEEEFLLTMEAWGLSGEL